LQVQVFAVNDCIEVIYGNLWMLYPRPKQPKNGTSSIK
jgi:hypothetical protein